MTNPAPLPSRTHQPIVVGDFHHARRVLRKIADAGTSEVFLVQGKNLARKEILKRARPSSTFSWERLEVVFKNEARILHALGGQFAPPLFEFDSTALEIYMEFVDGYTLDRYLTTWIDDSRQFPADLQLLKLAIDIHQAVSRCHQRNVVLADLKPLNVLVAPGREPGSLTVTLIDFGSSILDGQIAEKPGDYSPGYGAPELLRSQTASRASDVYSLGAMLYALFRRIEPGLSHAPGDFGERASDVLPSLCNLIVRMLADDPSGRPSIVAVGESLKACAVELREASMETFGTCPQCSARVLVRDAAVCERCRTPLVRRTRVLSDSPSCGADPSERMYQSDREGNFDDLLFWAKLAHRSGKLTPAARIRAVEVALRLPSELAFAGEMLRTTELETLPNDALRRYHVAFGEYLRRVKQPLGPYQDQFQKAANRWPETEDLWVWLTLATPLSQRENFLRAALRKHPASGQLHFHLGEVLYDRQQDHEALEAWVQAARHGHRPVKFLHGIHQLARKLEDGEQEDFARRLLEGYAPTSVEDCLSLISFFGIVDDPGRALTLCDIGLRIAPHDRQLQFRKAESLLRQGKHELLIAYIKLAAPTLELTRLLARGHFELQQYEHARKALLDLPDAARKGLDWFYLASCNHRLNDLQGARESLGKGLSAWPGDPNLKRLAVRFDSRR